MVIIWPDGAELRLLPTHPQSWVSGHADSKWLISLLLATDSEVLQRSNAAAQVQSPHLVHPETSHWQQA